MKYKLKLIEKQIYSVAGTIMTATASGRFKTVERSRGISLRTWEFYDTEVGKVVPKTDLDCRLYCSLTGLGRTIVKRGQCIIADAVYTVVEVTEDGIAVNVNPDKLIPLKEFFEKWEFVP